MALGFGQSLFNRGLFEQRDFPDDGAVTLSKQFAVGDTAPTLTTIGEVVFWEKGIGPYDEYDSSINSSLWTVVATKSGTTNTASVTETATYIQCYVLVDANGGTPWGYEATTETKALPALTLMSEVVFRVASAEVQSTNSGRYIRVFGTVIWGNDNGAGVGETDDSVWTITKLENGDWNVFDDGVFSETITPSDNLIEVGMFRDTGTSTGADREGYIRLYEISVDGGVYMLVRASDRTLQLPLDPLG